MDRITAIKTARLANECHQKFKLSEVFTIERIESLMLQAKSRFKELKISNIHTRKKVKNKL